MRRGRLLASGRPEPDDETLAERLAGLKVSACSVTPAVPWPDADVLLCDAGSDHDPQQIVTRGRSGAGAVRFRRSCAQVGNAHGQVVHEQIPGLVIIGRTHAASAGQSARLDRARGATFSGSITQEIP